MKTALIIGASRGIGHEFVRQYLAEGWRVLATHRKPDDGEALAVLGAEPHPLDVTDAAAVEALAARLAGRALDVLVINAGIFPQGDDDLTQPDEASFIEGMRTNVLAPTRLAAALSPLMAASGTVGFLSSRMGSMTMHHGTNALFYRSSKAALNMVVRHFANAWQDRGVRTIALHPGWVRTDMGGSNADIDAATSVTGLRRVLAEGGMERSGGFFSYDGEALPW
jgi:NAD(P)-dependent dehydrogenase (short-subunit alcohol dehydrogenase family)